MTDQVFVARERELSQLDDFLQQALDGNGQVCFVTGEAGAGKTALVTEFARRAQAEHDDLLVAIGDCNAQTGIGDPYLPFREILGMLTGDVERELAQGAITQENAGRLQNFLRSSGKALVELGPDLIEIFVPAAGLATRAGTYLAGRAGWLDKLDDLSGKRRDDADLSQERIFEQYTAVLRAMADEQPLVLMVDDLQWADTASINLLFHLARRLDESRVLLVGAYRPADVALGREGERHPLEQVLNEIKRYFGDVWVELGKTPTEGRAFVDALLDSEPNRLSEDFHARLYQHTGGHPLFTVELLRDLQERGDIVRDEEGHWIETPTLDWDTLPARVEGVIGERIGRLKEDLRETLTVAAVEGEDFTAQVVARVQELQERRLVRQLSRVLDKRHRLVGARGIQRVDGQRLSLYRFRHNLFQKYLYDSLDEVERSYLHEDVANVLEDLYGDRVDKISTQLARHFQEAGITEKAIDYLLQAGRQAVRLSAYEEAIDHLTKGLTLLETLPDTSERAERELDFLITLGPALMAVRGYTDPEVERVYGRARELCREVEQIPKLSVVLGGLRAFYLTRGDLQTARKLDEQSLNLAQSEQDSALLLQAHRVLGMTLCFLGEFGQARHYLEQGVALYDPQQHHQLVFRYGGGDPGVACRTFTAWVLWMLGYPAQALEMNAKMLRLAEKLDHPFSLAYALVNSAEFHQFCREAQTVHQQAEAVIAVATEQEYPFWLAQGMMLRGWALAQQQQPEEGILQIRQGLDTYQSIGIEIARPFYLALLADAHAKVGQTEQALDALDEALTVVEKNEERYYEAEIHRLRGELLLKHGGRGGSRTALTAEAEASFRQAVDVARRQEAKSWELRATVSLCRLWQQQGKREEARQMLAEIYGWFTEGFDTPDLQDARDLLAELS